MFDNYEKFKKYVYALTKIDLNYYKEKQMRRRIDTIATKHGCSNYDEYIHVLKTDKDKFEAFVNFLTINVSEFYRNPDQWKLMDENVIPKLIKQHGKNLHVWSAACSTGDEPYSLVMALSKHIPLSNIHITATDLDKQVLQKAQVGLYNEKSIANVPPEFKRKYFKQIGKSFQISDEIKRCVTFKEHNLLKDPYPSTGLAQLNKKVVMIDTDIGLRNLDVVMGLENRIVYNLVDVIEGKCRIRQALIKDKRYPELCLLPSAQTRDKDAVTPEQMVALINELREEFDYILLDCPAGIEQGFKNAVAGADRALVVTTPEVSAIRDADRIVGLLEANEMKRIDLIVNRLRVDMVKRGEMMTVDDVTDILAVNLLGAVPDDEQIVISTNRGEPLVGTNCLAGKAYSNICHRIMGEEVPFLNLNEKQGMLEKLKDIFKKN